VGITAVVLEGLTHLPPVWRRRPAVRRMMEGAAAYLLSRAHEDGSIHDQGAPRNYSTSLAVVALARLDRDAYAETIRDGAAWIRSRQCTRETGHDPAEHISFGGFGYGSTLRPDLSNTWHALDALRAAGREESSPVLDRAVVFLRRCQNDTEINDMAKAVGASDAPENRGGAMYIPGHSVSKTRIEGHPSTGSMTAALLAAYLYCGKDPESPPVQGAAGWLGRHWSVEANPRNPGGGQQALYYYYRVLAKALDLYGEERVGGHDWRAELAAAITERQLEDGSWVNPADRFKEGSKPLVTGYCLTALGLCAEE
jgi:squalene-hopene/tetraprenyl-beta-curcumene cyclase